MSTYRLPGPQRPKRHASRRFALAYLVVGPLTVVLVVTNPGASGIRSAGPSGDEAIGTPTPVPSPTAPVITRIDLDAIPVGGLVAAFGALWLVVEDRDDHSLSLVRMDAISGHVQRMAVGMRTR